MLGWYIRRSAMLSLAIESYCQNCTVELLSQITCFPQVLCRFVSCALHLVSRSARWH